MASSAYPVYSGEIKVAIMRRYVGDGTVEIYSDDASKAETDPENCIDCCTAEDCLQTYGIEVDTRKASKKAKPSNNLMPSNWWKSPEMPTSTKTNTSSSSATSTRYGNGHASSSNINYHAAPQSESPDYSSAADNVASNDSDTASQSDSQSPRRGASRDQPFHYHSTHHVGSIHSFAASAAAAAAHHHYGQYPFAIVINQTPYLTEDDKRAVMSVYPGGERLRSDFTPAEQADWEEREWKAMQEDEYEREAPLPSTTYRSRNLSPEGRDFADSEEDYVYVRSDGESASGLDTPVRSRRGSFTTSDEDFHTCHCDSDAESSGYCRRPSPSVASSSEYHTCQSDVESERRRRGREVSFVELLAAYANAESRRRGRDVSFVEMLAAAEARPDRYSRRGMDA